MAYSTQRVTSDGTLVLLDISIEYFDRSEIAVLFNGVIGAYSWAWVGDTEKKISFSPAVPNTVEVMLVRTTDLAAVRHMFTLGAQFTTQSLDEDLLQILHIAQEAKENATIEEVFHNLNMHGYRIINIGDGIDPQDVPSMAQMEVHDATIVGYKDAAQASAEAAAQSAALQVNVRLYGAVGDGVADDTTAIQNAVNAAMAANGVVHFDGPAVYKITAPITVKVTRDLVEETPGATQYSDNCAAFLVGFGSPVIKASGALAHMLELVFDTLDSDIAPFYSKIQGLGFDGSNTAAIGIKSNYCLGVTYENNRFFNLPVGISYAGYGVFRALYNNFKCSTGIKLSGGGGDSLISGNDFYAAANSTSGLVFEYYGGNSRVISNVFTNQDGYTTTFAIKLDGTTAPVAEEVRNVSITDNEFCGYTTGIYAVGKGGGTYNVYDCTVFGNHTLPYGSSNPGRLIEAIDCSGFNIANNKANSISYSVATTISGMAFTRTLDFKVSGNHLENYENSAMRLTDCVRTTVSDNSFYDAGKLGAGYEVVRVSGASSSRNYFVNNRFYQSSDTYAENGIIEVSGANATRALENVFLGLNRPFTTIGATSVMKNEEYGAEVPTGGYWNRGDVLWNTSPSAAGAPGWVCVTAGAPGTWKAMASLAA